MTAKKMPPPAPGAHVPAARWPVRAIAAAILCLTLAMLHGCMQPQAPSADELMALHLRAAPKFEAQMGGADLPRPVDHAVLAERFAAKDFAAMDSIFVAAPDSLLDLEELYMHAVALAELHNDLDALVLCNRIAMAQDRNMTERNMRLKVLLLIRLGKLDRARHDFALLKTVTTQPYTPDTKAIEEWLEAQE